MVREITLEELQTLSKQMPLMVEIHPLSLAFLPEETVIFQTARELAVYLDSPPPQPTHPTLALQIDLSLCYRLPAFRCLHDPLTTELNQVLLKRFGFIRERMICQSQVAWQIAQLTEGDLVILMLVDGLSYADVKRYAPQWLPYAKPVLVDGVSETEQGMLRIVGDPPLAYQLFDQGFRRLLGFTYWEREREPLTQRLFAGFGDQVRRVRSFSQALNILEQEELRGAFVQIVRAGLDEMAHRHRETRNLAAEVEGIFRDMGLLSDLVRKKGLSGILHMVSDHGILWAQEHHLTEYEFTSDAHPRHYEYAKQGKYVLNVTFREREFALLAYPFLRRPLRANEWGVHGGLSFEESVVPWILYPIAGARQ
jgi:hypothetical protein